MKFTILACLIAMLLATGVSITCEDGFYPNANNDGDDICYQCPGSEIGVIKCDDSNNAEELNEGIEGLRDDGLTALCPPTAFTGLVNLYWMDNNCVIECKEGCQTCYIDYDFCLDCEPGYVWNDDYTCLPSVIGLLATTLFLLVVGTVFIVISFMKVNAAAK